MHVNLMGVWAVKFSVCQATVISLIPLPQGLGVPIYVHLRAPCEPFPTPSCNSPSSGGPLGTSVSSSMQATCVWMTAKASEPWSLPLASPLLSQSAGRTVHHRAGSGTSVAPYYPQGQGQTPLPKFEALAPTRTSLQQLTHGWLWAGWGWHPTLSRRPGSIPLWVPVLNTREASLNTSAHPGLPHKILQLLLGPHTIQQLGIYTPYSCLCISLPSPAGLQPSFFFFCSFPFHFVCRFVVWWFPFILCLYSLLFGFCESIVCFWFVVILFFKYVNPSLYLLALNR